MQTGTLPVIYFGKLPSHGDFVRYQASGPTLQAMDVWLQQGLHFAQTRLGPAFDAAYDGAGAFAFYFAPRHETHVLTGMLRPSRDRVGRAYPLLIALEVEADAFDARDLAQVPLRFNRFFERTSEIAQEAVAGQVGHHELTARIDPLSALVEGETSVAFFGRYLQQMSLTSFWERLWGHPQDSRKYLLFKNLLDILQSLRDGVPPRFPLVLRFPLCPDGRTPNYDVSFWLGVCLRLLGYPDLQPTFFWTPPEATRDTAPFLLLALRPPPAKTFAYLLPASLESDTLCVLETMGAQKAALAALSIPDRYGRLLEDERLTLWDFLKQL